MPRCFIGLGANIGNPLQQLRDAVDGLRRVASRQRLAVSPVYQSTPLGPSDQPDFLNAVAGFDTQLAAEQVLDSLQAIERDAGRIRGRRWGPRTLDLDLLIHGDHVIDSPRLILPHPRIAERDFVLVPLADLTGTDFVLPGKQVLGDALARCPDNHLQRIAASLVPGAPEPGALS